jgi:predicted RNA-binding Zn-ribbon protein involved in translation (DUF1610 family)
MVQVFEASEVDTYKCEICGYSGRNWVIGENKYFHEEIIATKAKCPRCKGHVEIIND